MAIKWIIAIIAIIVIAFTIWGVLASKVERPKYQIISRHQNIEIREYPAHITASVTVKGKREAAINQGFRQLADYIFGNNRANTKISMTAPVNQTQGEKIAMTAPMTQTQSEKIAMTDPVIQEEQNHEWQVSFIMPSKFTLETLPKPNNKNIVITKHQPERFSVIRFSGTASTVKLEKMTKTLEQFMQTHNLKPESKPAYAFYNPPWTLPFLRRNEVMIKIRN